MFSFCILVFSAIFDIVFTFTGLFYKGDALHRSKYHSMIIMTTEILAMIGLSLAVIFAFMSGNWFYKSIFILLFCVCVILFSNTVLSTLRIFRTKKTFNEMEAVYELIKENDKKDQPNLLFEYFMTRKRNLKSRLLSEGYCSKKDLLLLKNVFRYSTKDEVRCFVLSKMIMDEDNNKADSDTTPDNTASQ